MTETTATTPPGDDRRRELVRVIDHALRQAGVNDDTHDVDGVAQDVAVHVRRHLAASAETGGGWDRERLVWETTCPDCGQLVDTVLAQHDETPEHTCRSSLAPAPPPPVELAAPAETEAGDVLLDELTRLRTRVLELDQGLAPRKLTAADVVHEIEAVIRHRCAATPPAPGEDQGESGGGDVTALVDASDELAGAIDTYLGEEGTLTGALRDLPDDGAEWNAVGHLHALRVRVGEQIEPYLAVEVDDAAHWSPPTPADPQAEGTGGTAGGGDRS